VSATSSAESIARFDAWANENWMYIGLRGDALKIWNAALADAAASQPSRSSDAEPEGLAAVDALADMWEARATRKEQRGLCSEAQLDRIHASELRAAIAAADEVREGSAVGYVTAEGVTFYSDNFCTKSRKPPVGTELFTRCKSEGSAAVDAFEALEVALKAYSKADYAWTKQSDPDEPRHRYAMREAIAAIAAIRLQGESHE
jgi:nitroreductase